ncbi:hypothetical protein GCM10008932_00820 [Alkalibacterium iburiense]|uniref:DUF2628 domain-containing protein n=1 Tax=Alkalibacterium iburiense TaxID=290589 RepID=A0ABN0WZV8_9LACT
MKVIMEHPSGMVKEVKKGFSWTVFFFGLFVPLIRGDLKWAAIMFALSLLAGSLSFGLGSLFISLIFSFIYNKLYIKELLEKGYRPAPEFEVAVSSYVNS